MKIDVGEINAILFRLGNPPGFYKKYGIKFRSGILMGILIFLRDLICSFYLFPVRYAKVNCNYKGVVFLYETINQKNALAPIIDEYRSSQSLLLSSESLPLWHTYIYALPYLFRLFGLYCSAEADEKKVIRAYFGRFWQSYGVYIFFRKVVRRYAPRVIVMANDHNVWQKCLIQIANEQNIETIYVQHASVSELFPSLHFSYAFLDGRESWEKYKKTGMNKGNIYLTGGVRFDTVSKLIANKGNTNNYVVGIAANALDSPEKIKKVCLGLLQESDKITIVFRPHPEILNNVNLIKWCLSQGISISYPYNERVYEFLFRINLLISNESAIHLDALICHTNTLLYNMSDTPVKDYYGYIQKGLIVQARTLDELLGSIRNNKINKASDKIIRYYHAAYRTKYEGQIAPIISKLIGYIVSGSVSSFHTEYGWIELEHSDSYSVFSLSE